LAVRKYMKTKGGVTKHRGVLRPIGILEAAR